MNEEFSHIFTLVQWITPIPCKAADSTVDDALKSIILYFYFMDDHLGIAKPGVFKQGYDARPIMCTRHALGIRPP